MAIIRFTVTILAVIAIFFLQGSLIDALGWKYFDPFAPTLTKIHLATYLFAVAAALTLIDIIASRVLLDTKGALDPILRSWQFLFYAGAATLLLVRATAISALAVSGGEQSLAIVTYITPVMVLISIIQLSPRQLTIVAGLIRVFFVVNSIMALAEAAVGYRFIKGFLDKDAGLGGRAAALSGHPLNGAVLSGLIIILLVFGPRRFLPKIARLPEVILHGVALFAFGGRAALVLLVAVLLVGGLVAQRKSGEDKISILQRVIPLVMLAAGAVLVLFPPKFVSAALDRFSTAGDSSTAARFSALDIFGNFNFHQLIWGASQYYRFQLLTFYKTPFGIESSWLNLVSVFGLIVTVPLAASLLLLLWKLLGRLDRSAPLAILYFLFVTATSLSIGSKSLLISQLLLMLLTMADRTALIDRMWKLPRAKAAESLWASVRNETPSAAGPPLARSTKFGDF